jgi:geranylgeranyl reductase family protein
VIDVAVVGGGPVGARVAARLASKGFSVEILEENREIGRPIQCAGLISPRTHKMLGGPMVLNKLDGARVRSPLGTTIEVRAAEPRALVIDRSESDKLMASEAARAGARIRLGWQLASMQVEDGFSTLRPVSGEPVRARLVVGADGACSAVRRLAGIEPPAEMLPAFEYELACPGDEGLGRSADIWLGRDVAPGFFAWKIPTGSALRLGLAAEPGDESAKSRLDRLVARSGLGGIQVLGSFAGVIPIGAVGKPFSDRVLLVGDSAGHVKPLSGGGLFTGMLAAEACASASARALDTDELTISGLSSYGREVAGELGSEVSRAASIRAIFRSLDDRALDSVLVALSKPSALELVGREGDIDFPSRLSKGLLAKSPGLLGLAPRALKALL